MILAQRIPRRACAKDDVVMGDKKDTKKAGGGKSK